MRPLTRRDFLKLSSAGLGAWFLAECAPRPGAVVPTVFPTLPPVTPTLLPIPQATAVPTLAPLPPVPFPADLAAGRLTDNASFYVQSISGDPDLNPLDWCLKIGGLVEREIELDLTALRGLPFRKQMQTLECIGNPAGGRLIGNAVWRGTPLAELLRQAGVKPEATHLQMTAADEYVTSVPVERGLDERSLLAYEMNGEALPGDHGSPVRVLLPDVYGQKQPKWVVTIWAVDHYEQGTWEARGWSDEATINVNTRVETPANLEKLAAGQPYPLTGVAFADTSGISAVDVSVDGGATYSPAELLPGPTTGVWTLWRWLWENPTPGKHLLVARAADGNGVQTVTGAAGVLSGVFPNGTHLAHRIRVMVEA